MINQAKPKFNIFWLYGCIALLIIGFSILGSSGETVRVTWPEVESQMIEKGRVERAVVVNDKEVEITLKDKAVEQLRKEDKYRNIPDRGPQFVFRIGSLEKFQEDFEKVQEELPPAKRVSLEFEGRENVWGGVLSTIIPIAIFIGLIFFMTRGMRGGGASGGVFNVGKAKAQMFDKDNRVSVSFKDVAGLEEAKVEIMEIVDFLKNPDKYRQLGGKIPKGALLVGPPGTGKTLLAKAVAGEANVPFFSISGSDFVEMFVGVGASRVRDLFRQAKEKAPCIVFIDEIDAIGRARNKAGGFNSNEEHENTLNQLLTEMDGFGSNSGVIILAATNRADILDKALMRAGRFDRQIYVELPDLNDRVAIFKVHLKKIKIDDSVDIELLARQTPGFSGADIANVCNEAALIAARHNKKSVEKQDFIDAVDRIVGGLEKRSKITTDEEKRSIAIHEAGHATISWHLRYANPLIKVTIVPRGKALGAAWYLPEERQITPSQALLDEMCATLGGRAAEELFLGRISTGAVNDLERVTKQAYAMVVYYGMSDRLPNLCYYDSTGSDYGFSKPYSGERARIIDEEVSRIISEQYERAKQILSEHSEGLTELAGVLISREVIFTEDVEKIFGKRQWTSRTDEILAAREAADKKAAEDKKDEPENDGSDTDAEASSGTASSNDGVEDVEATEIK